MFCLSVAPFVLYRVNLHLCHKDHFLSQLLCSVKKLKQEVLLDQCCLHLVKWSISNIAHTCLLTLIRVLVEY